MTDKIKNNTKTKKIEINAKTSEPLDADKKSEDKKEAGDSNKNLEKKLNIAQAEAKESYDRFLRVSAEFENYKKRSAREMDEFRKFSNELLLKEMLPVLDNLERAINSANTGEQTNSSVIEGVEMIRSEIVKIFDKFGVKAIESTGRTFDPGFHEAAMQKEVEGIKDNIVLEEYQKGYMLHDRLLRPAMVVVSKAKQNNN